MKALSDDVSYDDSTLKILDKQEITSFSLQTEPKIQTIVSNNICPHGLVSGTCLFCAEKMDTYFRYMHENLSFSVNEITRVSEQDLKNLLGRRKLYLVLDLDHTLLHSVSLDKLTAEEEYLCTQRDSLPDSLRFSLYRLDHMNMLTKLRPFVHSFLREASDLFEMYICTRGRRMYVLEMAKLIDPDNVYFNNYSKVIAREDFPKKIKNLDVFSGKENAVVILDDTEKVWVKDKRNLIVAKRYHYFDASLMRDKDGNVKSYSVLKTDESERSGPLESSLNVLRCVHAEFFNLANQNKDLGHQDVRQVLAQWLDKSKPKKTIRRTKSRRKKGTVLGSRNAAEE